MQSWLFNRPLFQTQSPALKQLQWISVAALGSVVILPLLGLGSGGYSICWMYNATHLPCPGCGLTRSVIAFFHLEWRASWYYNPFGIPVAALFGLLALSAFSHRINRLVQHLGQKTGRLTIWFFMCLALFGLWRIWAFLYAPESLGGFEIVTHEKTLADLSSRLYEWLLFD
ncbi:MAG: DUF2752 domain-containing protein [Leptospiraceae bacterium]|nr:DUF2752 domain-containing protein [Leptospiraceae bacterium]